jgi:hypothetical protein
VIDWLTVQIPCPHIPVASGKILCLSSDGSTEWETNTGWDVVGSGDAKLRISTVPGCVEAYTDARGRVHLSTPDALRIHGNLTKFLQGHGLWGGEDALALVKLTLARLTQYRVIDWLASPVDYLDKSWVTRIDVTRNFKLGSDLDVLEWLRSVGSASTMVHRGRGSFSHDTLYFGKHSRRWALKMYPKGPEFAKNDARRIDKHYRDLSKPSHFTPGCTPLPPIPFLPRKRAISNVFNIHGFSGCHHAITSDELVKLSEYATGLVRIESVYRGLELKDRNLSLLPTLTPSACAELWESAMSTVTLPSAAQFRPKLSELPPRLAPILALWMAGQDLRQFYSKPTYYRHRKKLLAYGINIDVARSSTDEAKVIPFLRPLTATPVGVPDWARGTPLACVA